MLFLQSCRPRLVRLSLLTVVAAASVTFAADWAQWRGPSFNGFSPETNLPTTWSQTENVAWKTALPGPGASTPIIVGDRVFVTAIERESKRMWALCLDRLTGKVLWRRGAGEGFFGKTGNLGASPSPLCDGERVYFLFGNAEFFACDLDGNFVWRRNLEEDEGKFCILWKWGGTPLLWDGKLYLAVLHRHDALEPEPGKPKPASYLLCVDPRTGKDLWRHVRPTDAPNESKEAYITPYPYTGPKGTLIILPGGDYVTAHDPETGREVWRSPNYNPRRQGFFRVVPSAVGAKGIVTGYVPRGSELLGIRADGAGQLGAEDIVWRKTKDAPDVCTPLVMNDRFYVLDGRGRVMSCLEPTTGEVVWRGELGVRKPFQASPTGADGKLYCINHDGIVVVLEAGDQFKVLSRIEMGGQGVRATIAVAHGQLFIRTSDYLYCIGKQ